jgi:hypothetical protein
MPIRHALHNWASYSFVRYDHYKLLPPSPNVCRVWHFTSTLTICFFRTGKFPTPPQHETGVMSSDNRATYNVLSSFRYSPSDCFSRANKATNYYRQHISIRLCYWLLSTSIRDDVDKMSRLINRTFHSCLHVYRHLTVSKKSISDTSSSPISIRSSRVHQHQICFTALPSGCQFHSCLRQQINSRVDHLMSFSRIQTCPKTHQRTSRE